MTQSTNVIFHKGAASKILSEISDLANNRSTTALGMNIKKALGHPFKEEEKETVYLLCFLLVEATAQCINNGTERRACIQSMKNFESHVQAELDLMARPYPLTPEEQKNLILISGGWKSPYFSQDDAIALKNPIIYHSKKTIATIHEMIPTLQEAKGEGRDLLVLAPGFHPEVIATFVINRIQEGLNAVAAEISEQDCIESFANTCTNALVTPSFTIISRGSIPQNISQRVVPGGGVALVKASKKRAFDGAKFALAGPLKKLSSQAVVEEVRNIEDPWIGFNPLTGKIEDLLASKILDPLDTVKKMVSTAVLFACNLLMSDVLILEEG